MARKTKQEAQETRQHILDVALRLFSQQGVSSTSLGEIAKAAGVTRGAIYWHFKDKSDLFSEIWELSESNIGELELEYQAKFPGDPLSVLREILIPRFYVSTSKSIIKALINMHSFEIQLSPIG